MPQLSAIKTVPGRGDTTTSALPVLSSERGTINVDDTNVSEAIEAGNGKVLLFKGGTYRLNAPVVKAFTADQVWMAREPVRLLWQGGTAAAMFHLTTAGFNFRMDGPFELDGGGLCRQCLRVEDIAAGIGQVRLRGVRVRNAYSSLRGAGAAGALIVGGFRHVRLERCGAFDISRDAGVGVPTSQGSIGIGVAQSGGFYAREVEAVECEIGGVTSKEADGASANVDCDGLVVTGPPPVSFVNGQPPTVLLVRGGRFHDNRGRHIKSQTCSTVISGVSFSRSAMRSIAEGTDIDIQYGRGLVDHCRFSYDAVRGSAAQSPFGSSFGAVTASVAKSTTIAGALHVDTCIFNNNFPAALGDMPYLVVLSVGAGATFDNVSVENIRVTGAGRLRNLVRAAGKGSFSGSQMNINRNHIVRLAASLLSFSADVSALRLNINENVSTEGTQRSFVDSDPVRPGPLVYGRDNVGFIARSR